jgi:hypothetical protein
MKYLKKFGQLRESIESIDSICKRYNIKGYTINVDGTVDVDGDVNLSYMGLTKLPLKFGKVIGNFECSKNHLKSLMGGPSEVFGYFNCSRNYLTNLVGAPVSVGGYFSCHNNKLISLEGGPTEVGGYFNCYGNPVYYIWNLFNRDKRFLEKLGGMYNGGLSPFLIKDHNYLRGDILEEIADELGITLVPGWQGVEKAGYQII